MLSSEAITSAVPLTQELMSKGMSLMPLESTPLAALVRESIPGHDVEPINEFRDLNQFAFGVECTANAKQPGTDIIPHDLVMDEVVPVVADSVRRSMTHARNVVIPQVEDMVRRVTEAAEQLTAPSILGAEVVVVSPPAPFVNSVFENSIQKYAEYEYNSGLQIKFAFPDMSAEDLRKLIDTKSNDLEKDIDVWLAELPETFLHDVWSDLFMLHTTSNPHQYVTAASSTFGRSNVDMNRLLAIHLMARNLFDAPPEGVNASLLDYNTLIADLRNSTGSRLYFENQEYYAEVGKRKILVRSISSNKVFVNAEVYKQWITEGGENEILFGLALVRNPVRDVESITARKDEYLKEWNRHCAIVTATEANHRFVRMKEFFLSAFRSQVIEDQDPELNREALIVKFNQMLQSLSEKDFACLHTLSMQLICRTRYPHTDAEQILTTINRVSAENQKIDTREAAAIAIIEYIAGWLCSQMKVV